MNRFLHAIYCDDIREEKSNKLTLVGMYSADLYVAEFPTIVPKLALLITLVTPADQPFRSLVLRIKKDEETLLEATIPEEELTKLSTISEQTSLGEAAPLRAGHSIALSTLRTIANLSPFPITGPFTLRVIANTETGDLRCPALKVGLSPLSPRVAEGPAVSADAPRAPNNELFGSW